MILSLHSITGAILASNSNNIGQAIVLGIISHYFLDSIPHVEYKIENIQKGDLKMAARDFAKIFLDLLTGLIVILYLIQNKNFDQSILILTGAFSAIFPDGLGFLDLCVRDKNKNIFTKFLKLQADFHKKIHSSVTSFKTQIIAQIIMISVLLFFVLK